MRIIKIVAEVKHNKHFYRRIFYNISKSTTPAYWLTRGGKKIEHESDLHRELESEWRKRIKQHGGINHSDS